VAPPNGGTAAMLAEYRVWDRARSADEIRADFDRSFEGEALPPGLVKYYPGGGSWGKLTGSARVTRTLDPPPVLTATEARAQAGKLAKFRALAEKTGDMTHGKQLVTICLTCHTIQGQGGNIGPNLSGAGAMNIEALLRSILTPNAAMEAGYRVFRVELNGDELIDGFLVSQDNQAVILRIPNSEDRRIPRKEIRRAAFVRRSLMPEGLLESIPEKDATDLLAYLKTLK
jgi:putative heme-binding domain-containing protein